MKSLILAAGLSAAAVAHAQVASVTDPSAYKPDKPKTVAPAAPAQAPATQATQPPTAATIPPPIAQSTAPSPVQVTQVAPAPDTSGARPLNLTCFGGGTANKLTVTHGYGTSNYSGWVGGIPYSGSGNASATVYGQRQQAFGDQVDVRLFGGDDRIRLPRTILPPIHGGNAGWFKLKNVVADARSIRASAGINFINSPKVHIDRVTGTISISGKAGDYVGQCQVIEADAAPQF